MQLASYGTRFARRVYHTNGSRSIHVASFLRPIPNAGLAQKILHQSRAAITSFFTHLTTPGTLRSSSASSVSRTLHSAAQSHISIKNRLSLPVRTALSRPIQTSFLPRAPSIPRCTTQVGLNTARNFSSARPIFQNLVENVPITGRAFLEADCEVKMRGASKEMVQKSMEYKLEKSRGKKMIKPRPAITTVKKQQEPVVDEAVRYETEMGRYFRADPVPNVVACLLIPLAPTPASRDFPPPFPSPHPSLLPLSALTSLRKSYTTHSLRVASLFTHLDKANVWNRGVTCTPYACGPTTSDEATCTFLKVEFNGWTKAEVRGVIGESGTGWCVLEERRDGKVYEDGMDDECSSSIFSETSSEADVESQKEEEDDTGAGLTVDGMDLTKSFILPTLDFSSSFADATLPPSDTHSLSDYDWDLDWDGWDVTDLFY